MQFFQRPQMGTSGITFEAWFLLEPHFRTARRLVRLSVSGPGYRRSCYLEAPTLLCEGKKGAHWSSAAAAALLELGLLTTQSPGGDG